MLPENPLLRTVRNMSVSDNTLIREGLQALHLRLPPGWSASEPHGSVAAPKVEVAAPDKRIGALSLHPRPALDPNGARRLVEVLTDAPHATTPVVVAPYLSESTRTQLRARHVGYLDLTGNARIVLPEPGLFIETQGALENPNREDRPARSLRGPKAGRVARALIETSLPPGVRELAALTRTDAGYVSRVLSLLDSEALISRGKRGRIEHVDWPALLRRWAQEAPLDARGHVGTYLEPRGLSALQTRLRSFKGPYVFTGSLAAVVVAPIAPARLATLWVRDSAAAAVALALRPADVGANVMLVETDDGDVFDGAVQQGGLWHAAPCQAALDSLTSPGRGPQEGEALIAWMQANEAQWRR
jgi:hypothetical protein